jgi:hypothetical protein
MIGFAAPLRFIMVFWFPGENPCKLQAMFTRSPVGLPNDGFV